MQQFGKVQAKLSGSYRNKKKESGEMPGLDSRSREDLLEEKIKLNETRIATKIQDL
jgi:hypothetical protein